MLATGDQAAGSLARLSVRACGMSDGESESAAAEERTEPEWNKADGDRACRGLPSLSDARDTA